MGQYSSTFYSCLAVSTDGSKDLMIGKTGAGVFIPDFYINLCKRLTNDLSACSTEMVAIIVWSPIDRGGTIKKTSNMLGLCISLV